MSVTSVETIKAMRLRIRFSDGYVAELDLAPLPNLNPVFDPLRDPKLFATVRVACDTISWGDLDVCPDVLRLWCESGRVLSPEETNRHFSKLLGESHHAVK